VTALFSRAVRPAYVRNRELFDQMILWVSSWGLCEQEGPSGCSLLLLLLNLHPPYNTNSL
ncbi:MAG TPA: hypothetical protein VLL94_05905, partial [Nitrospiraceae bacterium]|nr:hypothetical protein [Nitrospiraceae bacterium]